MFCDYNNFSDDGVYSALRVMNYLSRVSGNLDSFRKILPKIHVTKTIKVPCFTNKFEVIEQIRSQLISDDVNIQENEENAILVQRMEGWYIIRTSQTENIISVRCEGFKQELLDSLLINVEQLFSEVGLSLW
jgi:phosphomannomutase